MGVDVEESKAQVCIHTLGVQGESALEVSFRLLPCACDVQVVPHLRQHARSPRQRRIVGILLEQRAALCDGTPPLGRDTLALGIVLELRRIAAEVWGKPVDLGIEPLEGLLRCGRVRLMPRLRTTRGHVREHSAEAKCVEDGPCNAHPCSFLLTAGLQRVSG